MGERRRERERRKGVRFLGPAKPRSVYCLMPLKPRLALYKLEREREEGREGGEREREKDGEREKKGWGTKERERERGREGKGGRERRGLFDEWPFLGADCLETWEWEFTR